MEEYKNNRYAVAIRGMFSEYPQLHDHFNMEEEIERKVGEASVAFSNLIRKNVDLLTAREMVMETVVLEDLKKKASELPSPQDVYDNPNTVIYQNED